MPSLFSSIESESSHPSIEYAGPPRNPSVRDGGTPPFFLITSFCSLYLKLLNLLICNSRTSGSTSTSLLSFAPTDVLFFLVSFILVCKFEVYKDLRRELRRPEYSFVCTGSNGLNWSTERTEPPPEPRWLAKPPMRLSLLRLSAEELILAAAAILGNAIVS